MLSVLVASLALRGTPFKQATPFTYENFVPKEATKQTVVVRFVSPRCRACKAAVPKIDQLAKQFPGGMYYEIMYSDENKPFFRERSDIKQFPYVEIFAGGQRVNGFVCCAKDSVMLGQELAALESGMGLKNGLGQQSVDTVRGDGVTKADPDDAIARMQAKVPLEMDIRIQRGSQGELGVLIGANAIVEDVNPAGPAATVLFPGDTIVAVDGELLDGRPIGDVLTSAPSHVFRIVRKAT